MKVHNFVTGYLPLKSSLHRKKNDYGNALITTFAERVSVHSLLLETRFLRAAVLIQARCPTARPP